MSSWLVNYHNYRTAPPGTLLPCLLRVPKFTASVPGGDRPGKILVDANKLFWPFAFFPAFGGWNVDRFSKHAGMNGGWVVLGREFMFVISFMASTLGPN